MVANYTTMRVPARTKELIAAETVKRSPERRCESLHKFATTLLSCLRWGEGGFRNNWEKMSKRRGGDW